LKKNYLWTLLILSIGTSCSTEKAVPTKPDISKHQLYIDALAEVQERILASRIDSVFSNSGFNGSVSVTRAKKVIYKRVAGFEDFRIKKALTNKSVFAIGSVSKQFTAALILALEEQGKLSTADLAGKYLKSFSRKPFDKITIHQILNHTSGITDVGPGVISKPGAEFHYSNKGYRVLGEIIEKVSGKSYDDNFRELSRKAGMVSSFTADHFEGEYLAGAYFGSPERYKAVPNMPERLAQATISVAAGGVLSTSADLHKWNLALHEGRLFKTETLEKMRTKTSGTKHPILGEVGYGYGIMMSESPRAYFHSGYVKGSPSLLIYYPASRTSVVILSNIADMDKGKAFVFGPHKKIKEIMDGMERNKLWNLN